MTDNERVRASVSAIVDDLARGHHALELPVDEFEFSEAWTTIVRIELTMLHAGQGVLD